MKTYKKAFLILFILCLSVGTLVAKESSTSGSVKLTASTAPEFKIDAGYTVKLPIWGEGPLFGGNNVKIKGGLGITPVTISVNADVILTPIAVAEISLGGQVGTGWNFDLMGVEGLRKGDGISPAESDTMNGIYAKAKGGVALQFDTAAIWPGAWTSVVLRTYHEMNYQTYTNKFSDTPSYNAWEFETGGLHQDGWNYKGEYVVGYQMPLIINMAAIMVETYLENIGNTSNYETPMTIDVGIIANFAFTDSLNLTVIPQFSTRKTDKESRFVSQKPFGWKRLAAQLTYSF